MTGCNVKVGVEEERVEAVDRNGLKFLGKKVSHTDTRSPAGFGRRRQ